MNNINKLKYAVRILLGTLLGVYLGGIVLLNIPYVQGKLSVFVSEELKNLLHTEISIGKVDIGVLNRIIVEDVKLSDQQGGDLLKIARLSAKFELLPLLKKKITIRSVQLFGFTAHLTKETPQAVPNFRFVLDAFASTDTVKSQTDLRINSVLVRRGRVTYHVLSEPETPGRFNTNHLSVNDLAATLSLKAYSADSLNVAIRRFDFNEQGGLSIRKLSGKLTANNRLLTVQDFDMELAHTVLQMDSLTVRYDSLPELYQLTENVSYEASLAATAVLQDFTPFVPAFAHFKDPLDLQLSFSGQGKNTQIPLLYLTNRRGLNMRGEVVLANWNAGMDMYVRGKLAEFSTDREGIAFLTENLTGNPSPFWQRLGSTRFEGEMRGHLYELALNGLLLTDIGTMQMDLVMNTDKRNGNRSFSGNTASADWNLGKLLDQEDTFGAIDFNVELEGLKYKGQYPESQIKGVVSSLEYSHYKYENILLDGLYKDGGFNGQLAMDDDNGTVRIDGAFNTETAVPSYNLRAEVRNFRPNDLHLSERYEDTSFSFVVNADFTGNSIDDMNGYLSLDSLYMDGPDDNRYFMQGLAITAEQTEGQKELRVRSSFLTATVQGDFSYHTLPASILQTVQRYIPSLLSVRNNLPAPHNNFNFDFRMENAEVLARLFHIPLELQMPSTLKGSFNDEKEELFVEGHFPSFKYDGTRYDSGVLLCETPADRFKCSLRGAMLMKNGAMLSLSVDADAQDDHLTTTVNWGNNTDVTYGGKFVTRTRFSKTESNHPILRADIDIQPTKVVLNDTVWDIHPSHVEVDSGRVFVQDFYIGQDDRYLKINGKLASQETDSCEIDLKNIRLDYVLDIVQFDDVLFGGLITGKVALKSAMKEPEMHTLLKVHDFALNHTLLGEADIKGTWDKELGGVWLDAAIAEEGISATHATGYVSPKLKGLDLYIQTDSTNTGFLQPFLDGIFSRMEGRVNGHVRLFGDFKHLDLEGEVRTWMNAQVDMLNTSFRVLDDSVHFSPGSIDFRNVAISDREGHRGTINGYLHHTKLKNLTYHFNISGNELLMYDTHEADEVAFYGTVYGTGSVTLDGGNNALNVDANLVTGNNTLFTYITGMTTEAASSQFITFADKTPRRTFEGIETNLYHPSDARQNEEEGNDPPTDIRIHMLVEATPDATMRIIMDPVAGDDITARGSGTLQVNYFNKGDFRMFGSYTISEGLYKLSMQEVIRKDFTLQSGGTVSFTGDPREANLDVQAVYTVNSASLSDLGVDLSRSQGTVKVNCLMNLTGNLSNPDIKFDLDLPTVKEEDRELVRSITSTEEQMNTQIIYLLGIGKFYTYEYANGQSSNATSSLAFSTLSGQLNNMLSQWMNNKNWNIGANLSTGEGWTDVEAEAMLSGRLLNNRLLINGNFGYKENVLANSNFVGDFEAVWLLTKNGEFRLKGYNQTNDRYFTKSTLTTQGIGIMYKKDFDTWHELFRWFLRKRAATGSTSGQTDNL